MIIKNLNGTCSWNDKEYPSYAYAEHALCEYLRREHLKPLGLPEIIDYPTLLRFEIQISYIGNTNIVFGEDLKS